MPSSYMSLQHGSEFVTRCGTYLPDPFRQAALDMPRMRVTLNARRIPSVETLASEVAHQRCTPSSLCAPKSRFADAYEIAARHCRTTSSARTTPMPANIAMFSLQSTPRIRSSGSSPGRRCDC